MDNDEQQNLTSQTASEPPSEDAEAAPQEVAENSVDQIAEEAQTKTARKKKKAKQKKKNKNAWLIWGISVFFLSFALTVLFSFLTEISVKGSPA